MDLTDLEICRTIAKIELSETYKGMEERAHDGICVLVLSYGMIFRQAYNPLTDDALCFQLMVKYDIDVLSPYRKNGETKWEAQIFSKDYADAFSIYDESPNRVICLAIIEAHKESNNG